MNKVVHFEIPADDMARAKSFYEKVFGWQVNAWDKEYFMATTVPVDDRMMPKEPGAINGGFYRRSEKAPNPVLVINIPSVDQYIKSVEAAGGRLVTPKIAVGEMGFYARVTDSEGNVIGLWEDRN
ncbi:MAG: VOC family protein [Parcubacteria group bacterium]|nr:VOC family protein [Parcubacteria group bacterium]